MRPSPPAPQARLWQIVQTDSPASDRITARRRMRSGSYLINTARGSCVDTEALVRALEGGMTGAALHAVGPEPLPPGHALYSLPNVLLTPHAAFLSRESLHEARRRSCLQVIAALRGGIRESVVNPNVLAQPQCHIHAQASSTLSLQNGPRGAGHA